MTEHVTPRLPSAMAMLEVGAVPEGEVGRTVRRMARTERSILLRDGVARRLVYQIATDIDLDPDEEWQRYRLYRALSTAIWVRSDTELRALEVDEAIFADMRNWIESEAP